MVNSFAISRSITMENMEEDLSDKELLLARIQQIKPITNARTLVFVVTISHSLVIRKSIFISCWIDIPQLQLKTSKIIIDRRFLSQVMQIPSQASEQGCVVAAFAEQD